MDEREQMNAAGITGEDQEILIRSLDHIRQAGIKINLEDVISAAYRLNSTLSAANKAADIIQKAKAIGRGH
jgi:hypothetical protein